MIGSVSGKVLFTFMVRNRLPLAFLRDAKTSQTFTRIVNMLWEVAGPGLFRRMFRCIVPDNGTEFSDKGICQKLSDKLAFTSRPCV